MRSPSSALHVQIKHTTFGDNLLSNKFHISELKINHFREFGASIKMNISISALVTLVKTGDIMKEELCKIFPERVPAVDTEGCETRERICSMDAALAVYLNLLHDHVSFRQLHFFILRLKNNISLIVSFISIVPH
jgi:hypothetical protein